MTAPKYAELAGKLFAREGRSSSPPPAPAVRARTITAIAGALRARARRQRVVRWTGGLSAAAAVALATLGVARHALQRDAVVSHVSSAAPAPVQIVAHAVSGAASVVVSGARAPLADESPVAQGSRLITPANGRATLSFSTGTNVTVRESSDMSLSGDGTHQVLKLSAGSIDLHVAKLTAEQRFVVGTADAEVEVRGTQFHVSVVRSDPTCGHGTATRVAVTEGVVLVRHDGSEDRVAAGELWPSGCVHDTVPSSSEAMRASASRNRSSASLSTLAQENDLYQRAVTAMNGGDLHGAVNGFEVLLGRYPASPLAEDARVEIMKALAKTSPAQAAVAARQYLAAYPNGASRQDAEEILSAAP